METEILNNINPWLLAIIMYWVFIWKGYALWVSSKNNHKRWFIVLLVFNTLAILDIFYIFYIAKKTPRELIKALNSKV